VTVEPGAPLMYFTRGSVDRVELQNITTTSVFLQVCCSTDVFVCCLLYSTVIFLLYLITVRIGFH
jgi:hypothetical protein